MDLGRLIRARRKQLGLTLREISKRSGLSVSFLSQVERDLASPSMGSLVSLAKALGVSLSYFVDPPEQGGGIRKRDEIRFFTLDGAPIRYGRLSSSAAHRKLDALLVCIPPRYLYEAIEHAGEEYIHILTGRLKIKIGRDLHLLEAGDSAHFNSAIRHQWENAGDEEVRLVWVGTPPIF